MFLEEGQKRKIVEMALTSAKKRVSPQTGCLHLFAEDPLNQRQDPIPVLENIIYAYALFRSKLIENVQEGKLLLERMLGFEVNGNFPVNTHEYPMCRDPQLSAQLLPPFFYLLKDFSVVLGEVLLEKLQGAASRTTGYLTSIEENLSTSARNKLLAFAGKFEQDSWHPTSASEWAEFCICSQMVHKSIARALSVWDAQRFVYIGPAKERAQEGLYPALTLLDLFMGEYLRKFSSRSTLNHPVHLRAALIQPFLEEVSFPMSPGAPFVSIIEEGQRQCFTLYSVDELTNTHSFVLESKKGSWSIVQKSPKQFELTYTCDETPPLEMDSVEFAFYVAALDGVKLSIGDSRGTLFQSGDVISIDSPSLGIKVRMTTDLSQGQWVGHISKGNRSFQRSKEQYTAYDWKIGWRTLRRQSVAEVRIDLEIY